MPYHTVTEHWPWKTPLHDSCADAWHRNWRDNGMAFEHKDNTGSLFANDKRTQDNHPTHTGQGKIFGRDVWIKAWVKETNGKRYFSMSFKPKDEQKPQESAPQQDFQDDDIPF